jgi:hypothetical protein
VAIGASITAALRMVALYRILRRRERSASPPARAVAREERVHGA